MDEENETSLWFGGGVFDLTALSAAGLGDRGGLEWFLLISAGPEFDFPFSKGGFQGLDGGGDLEEGTCRKCMLGCEVRPLLNPVRLFGLLGAEFDTGRG